MPGYRSIHRVEGRTSLRPHIFRSDEAGSSIECTKCSQLNSYGFSVTEVETQHFASLQLFNLKIFLGTLFERMHNFSSFISTSSAVADLKNTQSISFVSYVGSSMNSTLREPEVMEIMPYNNRRICVGDVIFFLHPEADYHVVHRITRITLAGIFTRGDNSAQEDAYILQTKDIKG